MKKLALLFLLIVVTFSIALAEPLKVSFIYVGPVGDAGWSYAHDQGRQYIENAFGDEVRIDYIESVPEGADALSVIRGYAAKDYDLIFGTSFGYMDSMVQVSNMYPNSILMHCSGYKVTENLGTYFGRMYEPKYLAGYIAGKMTKTNKIGFVGAYPIPEVIRGIDAFAVGAKLANPDAVVHVIWVNTWYDPSLEKEAAFSLIDLGCDVLAQEPDSPATQQAAQERGIYSIGYNTDMKAFAPDAYLGAPVWNWGPYYENVVKSVLDGTWKSEQFWGGIAEGTVDLVISDLVPEDVKADVLKLKEKIINGELHPLAGPVYDQEGTLKIAEGEIPSDIELLELSWFVDNVVGNISE